MVAPRVPAVYWDGTKPVMRGTEPSAVMPIATMYAHRANRWMLRATLLGRPAVEVDDTALWESAIENVVVNRGGGAMPVGAQLPLVLPPRDRLVQRDD